MTTPIHFEQSEYEGRGRLCIGDFAEYSRGLTDGQAEFLAAWWRGLVENCGHPVTLWNCQKRLRIARAADVSTSTALSAIWQRKWNQKTAAHVTEHMMGDAPAEVFVPAAVRELWNGTRFGLFAMDTADDVDDAAFQNLADMGPPGAEILQRMSFAVLPWHHRLWIDLFCSRADVARNAQLVQSTAALVGAVADEVVDRYA